ICESKLPGSTGQLFVLYKSHHGSSMPFQRACGTLLHITSLPSRGGIGDLGEEAYRFIDFLAASHQRLWQVLPTGPAATGNSPYSATSAFAGNPLLISIERLAARGWLSKG